MELTTFFKKRLDYQKRAEKREVERINMGSGVDDTPYYNKIVEEMLMDLLDRIEAVEALMTPPAEEPEPPTVRKPKFT
jgi:hypothetical protein